MIGKKPNCHRCREQQRTIESLRKQVTELEDQLRESQREVQLLKFDVNDWQAKALAWKKDAETAMRMR